jgi:hypothetical protein
VRAAALAVLAAAVRSCKRGERAIDANGSDTSKVAAAPSAAAVAGPADCPGTGAWALCSVMQRLDRAGLAPRLDSAPADEAPLAQRGSLIHVGASDLEIYLFRDPDARHTAEKMLDGAKYVAYDAPLTIKQEPTLIRSANLIAILHSRNDHQRERVADALTAGPPQPNRP